MDTFKRRYPNTIFHLSQAELLSLWEQECENLSKQESRLTYLCAEKSVHAAKVSQSMSNKRIAVLEKLLTK